MGAANSQTSGQVEAKLGAQSIERIIFENNERAAIDLVGLSIARLLSLPVGSRKKKKKMAGASCYPSRGGPAQPWRQSSRFRVYSAEIIPFLNERKTKQKEASQVVYHPFHKKAAPNQIICAK